jgi:hypothetical protein
VTTLRRWRRNCRRSCRRRSASSSASVTTLTTTNVVRGLADFEISTRPPRAQIAGSGAHREVRSTRRSVRLAEPASQVREVTSNWTGTLRNCDPCSESRFLPLGWWMRPGEHGVGRFASSTRANDRGR